MLQMIYQTLWIFLSDGNIPLRMLSKLDFKNCKHIAEGERKEGEGKYAAHSHELGTFMDKS